MGWRQPCDALQRVLCIELPAPKLSASRSYPTGLEHAEFVVGQAGDGCLESKARLLDFVEHCKQDGVTLEFDFR